MAKKKVSVKTKIKRIAKYTTNILAIVNALIIGLNPIWNIPYANEISASITVVIGVIGTYLLGSKIKKEM